MRDGDDEETLAPASGDLPTEDLSPARWLRMEELFEQARDLPADERGPFLEGCVGEEDLRRRVERMLAADEKSEDRIAGVIQAAARQAADSEDETARMCIGPYRVLRQIGRGGMSTVYLAERDDEHYRQRVAVKVLRRGSANREMQLHLRRERQILAGLDHPHIAKLLDGGNTAEGLPYFVMDHVEGRPIDVHCESRGLTVTQRLELFLDVCSAVRYAHASLVIHRDLKPSNLLVTEDGTAKLLDFGIAKLLEPERQGDAAFGDSVALPTVLATPTATGLMLLTPEYASPEQVRGLPLTVASDIYALGVLLYELLTGVRPYAIDRKRGLEIERTICETRPERPSAMVPRWATTASNESQPGPPAARRPSGPLHAEGSAERLRRRLRGDLDNIVLKALRKEPTRRYESVEQLAEDLRRHLDGLPVRARPDTFGYRLGKFVRRNHHTVTATVVVLTLVVGLVGFYTHRLALERDRARQEEQEARQVSALLIGLFDAADPEQARGESITARELLDIGAVRIRAELSEQPELKAKLLDRIAAIYLRLGSYAAAERVIDEAESLRRDLYEGDHPEIAAGLGLQARWQMATGHYREAETLYLRGLEMRQRLLGTDHPDVAVSLTDLGELFFSRAEFDRSHHLFDEALEIRRRVGSRDPALATSLNNMAAVLYTTGEAAAALPLLEEALEIQLRHFDEVHPMVAETLSTLGSVHSRSGDVDRAREHFRRVLEIRRQIYGDDHPIVARSLTNLGNLLHSLGEYDNAAPLLREAVDVFRQLSDPRQTDFLKSLINLSQNLRLQGHPEAAEKLLREALETARRALDPDNALVPLLWMKLADALSSQDRLAAAAAAYQEALQLRRGNLPEGHGRIASPLVFLARLEVRREDFRAAELLLDEALGILRGQRPDHWLTAEANILLGICRMQQLRDPEAGELLREGVRILETGAGSAPADIRSRLTEQAHARLDELASRSRSRQVSSPE